MTSIDFTEFTGRAYIPAGITFLHAFVQVTVVTEGTLTCSNGATGTAIGSGMVSIITFLHVRANIPVAARRVATLAHAVILIRGISIITLLVCFCIDVAIAAYARRAITIACRAVGRYATDARIAILHVQTDKAITAVCQLATAARPIRATIPVAPIAVIASFSGDPIPIPVTALARGAVPIAARAVEGCAGNPRITSLDTGFDKPVPTHGWPTHARISIRAGIGIVSVAIIA